MIDSHILKVMQKSCPNYHVLSDAVCSKGTVCTCSRCMRGQWRSGKRECRPLDERLALLEYPRGYARVDKCGTCDRAQDPQMALPLDAPADNGGEVFP